MTDPIQLLEELDERWPNFFNVIKASNGFDVDGVGYPEMMALNQAMISDQEGIEMAVKAFMIINTSDDPKHVKWLQNSGFISKQIIEIKNRIDELESLLLCDDAGGKDIAEAVKELKKLKELSQKIAERSAAGISRGAGMLTDLIS